jgi:hypothetical protein
LLGRVHGGKAAATAFVLVLTAIGHGVFSL